MEGGSSVRRVVVMEGSHGSSVWRVAAMEASFGGC